MGTWKPVNWLPGKMIFYIGRVENCPVCIWCVCVCVLCVSVCCVYVCCMCMCMLHVCVLCDNVCKLCMCVLCVYCAYVCCVCAHTRMQMCTGVPCARALSLLTQQLAWKSPSLMPGPQTHHSNVRQVCLECLCPSDPQVPITPLALAVHGCSRHLLSLCPLQSRHPPPEMPT